MTATPEHTTHCIQYSTFFIPCTSHYTLRTMYYVLCTICYKLNTKYSILCTQRRSTPRLGGAPRRISIPAAAEREREGERDRESERARESERESERGRERVPLHCQAQVIAAGSFRLTFLPSNGFCLRTLSLTTVSHSVLLTVGRLVGRSHHSSTPSHGVGLHTTVWGFWTFQSLNSKLTGLLGPVLRVIEREKRGGNPASHARGSGSPMNPRQARI